MLDTCTCNLVNSSCVLSNAFCNTLVLASNTGLFCAIVSIVDLVAKKAEEEKKKKKRTKKKK